MNKTLKAYPNPKDFISPNDDEFDDNVLFDENEELEEQYIPNLRKEHKRQSAANDSKKNRWRIKD